MMQALLVWIKSGGTAWVVSLATHAAVLSVLSAILVRPHRGSGAILVDTRLATEDEGTEFTTLIDGATDAESNASLFESVVPVDAIVPQIEPLPDMSWQPEPMEIGQTATSGQGEARFFGVAGMGERIVYVVDASGSMRDENRFIRAREELLRSLDNLQASQMFYVIFFNEEVFPMFFPRRERKRLLPATTGNKRRARAWIQKAIPFGGTDQISAIELALSLNPDSMFILTDDDDLQLYRTKLAEAKQENDRKRMAFLEKDLEIILDKHSEILELVRERNLQGVEIHTIMMVVKAGAASEGGLMESLAQQNRGTFRYVP